jgi:predicted RNase H-like HicB family nuclease
VGETTIVTRQISEKAWVGHLADQPNDIAQGDTQAAVVRRLGRAFPNRFPAAIDDRTPRKEGV